jgi:hypothetical protein
LYNIGIRTFYVSGIAPLGCIPHQLALSQQPTCISSTNAQAQDFNTLLRSTLQGLNTALPDAMFLFGETYDAVLGLINNPGAHGKRVFNQNSSLVVNLPCLYEQERSLLFLDQLCKSNSYYLRQNGRVCRVYDGQSRMLWRRIVQRAGGLPANGNGMHKSGGLCLLGWIPPYGSCQLNSSKCNIHRGEELRYPTEHTANDCSKK